VFVPRTAPGDLVRLTELRPHKRFARARLDRVVEPGPDRTDPRCPHYLADECGGCQLQHLTVEAQLAARRGFVGDALRRIAGREVADPEIDPAASAFEYRAKLTLTASRDGRRIGLHPYGRPAAVFDLDWCHITLAPLMELWQVVRGLKAFLPRPLKHLVLRLDRSGGRHLLLEAQDTRVWTGAPRLLAELRSRGTEATIWWQPGGGVARALAGATQPYPATVFEQVNPVMGDRARVFAIEQLGAVAGCHVWDLYAGVGDSTARLAGLGATVESVELDRRAVSEAEARGPAATRHSGRVEDLVPDLRPPQAVLTNPPRTGMDERVTAALERLAPARIVYISCDPATLARDLARLPGYRIAGLRAFDLFPQTAHVETVALLERAS
jgi:23S rRNA (uracil1939-C5)-methyltransferase